MKDCMEMLPGRLKALKVVLTSGDNKIANLAWEGARRRYDGKSGAGGAEASSGELRKGGVTREERRVWQII